MSVGRVVVDVMLKPEILDPEVTDEVLAHVREAATLFFFNSFIEDVVSVREAGA